VSAPVRSFYVLCAAMLALVAPGAAQGRVEITSFAGMYVPTARVIDISAFCPGGPCGEVVKHESAPVFGARVTAWVRPRLALDLSFSYSGSGVKRNGLLAEIPDGSPPISGSQSVDTTGKASVRTGSVRLLVSLMPRTSRTALYVTGGLALVGHGGEAYSSVAGNTGWGPVVGAGGRFQLAPGLALRAELDDYVYQFSGTEATAPYYLGAVPGSYSSPLQNDLILSLGLSVTPSPGSRVAP